MKKFIVFCLMAFVMCVISSCSNIKQNIRNEIHEEIKCLSVKTYNINGKFYEFLPTYYQLERKILFDEIAIEECKRGIETCEFDISYYKILSRKKDIEKCKTHIEDYKKEIKRLEIEISDCYNVKETYKQTYKNGKLYIARYIKQNPRGVFENTYSYTIFLFDENKQFVEYNGKDFSTLVLNKFPKAIEILLE